MMVMPVPVPVPVAHVVAARLLPPPLPPVCFTALRTSLRRRAPSVGSASRPATALRPRKAGTARRRPRPCCPGAAEAEQEDEEDRVSAGAVPQVRQRGDDRRGAAAIAMVQRAIGTATPPAPAHLATAEHKQTTMDLERAGCGTLCDSAPAINFAQARQAECEASSRTAMVVNL